VGPAGPAEGAPAAPPRLDRVVALMRSAGMVSGSFSITPMLLRPRRLSNAAGRYPDRRSPAATFSVMSSKERIRSAMS